MDTSTSTFTECAQQLRGRVDAALRRYGELPEGCPTELREAVEYSLLGPGKRLRPMLVLMASEACGGKIRAALPAACAVEMVHAYSLVHDDLPAMDNDDLRRGRPTCHKKYGEALAILTGDALLALAFEVLAKDIQPPETAARCCAMLAEAAGACRLVGGQADDLAGRLVRGREKVSGTFCRNGPEGAAHKRFLTPFRVPFRVEDLEAIHHRKTGALLLAALRLGAVVAGADAGQTAALEAYGERLGLAFQITDDLLDVRGQEVEVGKRVGKDAHRGTLTFPGLLGIEQSERRAERLIHEAREALRPLGAEAGNLDALARYVLERNC